MEEIWKPIAGCESLYEVSNFGRVRSFDRYVRTFNGNQSYFKKGVELSQHITSSGYMYVNLQIDKVRKHADVHRLVAFAFVPNPSNFKEVNHIDENKLNNLYTNLEWCTRKYNMNYGTRNYRATICRSKKVEQLSIKGEHIAYFDSANEAMRSTNISQGTISKVCAGICKTAGGYVWKYAN